MDWSQVRETVLMLELAAGQVDAAMRDSNSSVDTLMDTFTSMADTLSMIDVALGTLPDTIGNGMVKSEIQENARQVSQKVHHAIIAFQFYDKLVQRLDHVCHSLSELSELVSNTGRLYNPQEWSGLQERIRSKYTMAEERGMFDAVMAGATVQEALKQYMTARMQEVEESGGEIELF
ncbi:MAG: hypothetical protein A3H93_08815 [Rhodocyclales bacterium RIFCSPLOWO2_02_FULL_63_24]|nr:MAG: hypothetical protein A2040_17625 [Rhodocyclales bacterium GWA2_65_19]OHC72514.1 MAG: hypothetical protein A3H93_08815 [Rhodocyclales bacterium RIFCSPLOWO2_02_FULL_63_24]